MGLLEQLMSPTYYEDLVAGGPQPRGSGGQFAGPRISEPLQRQLALHQYSVGAGPGGPSPAWTAQAGPQRFGGPTGLPTTDPFQAFPGLQSGTMGKPVARPGQLFTQQPTYGPPAPPPWTPGGGFAGSPAQKLGSQLASNLRTPGTSLRTGMWGPAKAVGGKALWGVGAGQMANAAYNDVLNIDEQVDKVDSSGIMGDVLGGAVAGGTAGAILGPATFGLSVPVSAAIGAGLAGLTSGVFGNRDTDKNLSIDEQLAMTGGVSNTELAVARRSVEELTGLYKAHGVENPKETAEAEIYGPLVEQAKYQILGLDDPADLEDKFYEDLQQRTEQLATGAAERFAPMEQASQDRMAAALARMQSGTENMSPEMASAYQASIPMMQIAAESSRPQYGSSLASQMILPELMQYFEKQAAQNAQQVGATDFTSLVEGL